MKKLIVLLFAVLLVLGCSLDEGESSWNLEQSEEVQESRSSAGFNLPICSNSSCPNKGKEMTKFVRVIFKNRKLTYNVGPNCSNCDRFHNHTHTRTVSLNLYQCTGCGKRQGGDKIENARCSSNYPSDVVQFPDKVLEKVVRIDLDKPTGNITKSDLLKVLQLRIYLPNEISNLDGLQFCKNLLTLEISQMKKLKDLTPLKGLTKLKKLQIDLCSIEDVTPLKDLTNLEQLDLNGNNISDISALKYLTNLYWLYLSSNNISDISSVKYLTKLGRLFIWNNQISDLSPISNLKYIRRLYVSNNKLSNIDALKGFKNLRMIDIEKNRVKSIVPLKDLEKIWYLIVYHNDMDMTKDSPNRKVVEAIENRNHPRTTVGWDWGNRH